MEYSDFLAFDRLQKRAQKQNDAGKRIYFRAFKISRFLTKYNLSGYIWLINLSSSQYWKCGYMEGNISGFSARQRAWWYKLLHKKNN